MHKIYREIADFFSKKSYLLPSLYGRGLGVGLLANNKNNEETTNYNVHGNGRRDVLRPAHHG